VTRKITRAVARIALGLQDKLYLGNLNAKRDWGHAQDYVEAMWLILQQDQPEDFVIATGVTTTVRDFVRMAFKEIGVELEFSGEGVNEVARVASSSHKDYFLKPGTEVVAVDPNYFRPTEVDLLIGDPSKAKAKLGWKPKRTVQDMVKEMVESDLKLFQRDKILLSNGMEILKNDE
jgi:GDPmannose 4,6-dehydratase